MKNKNVSYSRMARFKFKCESAQSNVGKEYYRVKETVGDRFIYSIMDPSTLLPLIILFRRIPPFARQKEEVDHFERAAFCPRCDVVFQKGRTLDHFFAETSLSYICKITLYPC